VFAKGLDMMEKLIWPFRPLKAGFWVHNESFHTTIFKKMFLKEDSNAKHGCIHELLLLVLLLLFKTVIL